MIRLLVTLLVGVVIPVVALAQSDTFYYGKSIGFEPFVYNEKMLDSLVKDGVSKIEKDSIAVFMQELVDFKTRFMLADNHRDIAVWIQNRFRGFGYTDVVLDSFQNTLEFPPRSGEMHTTWQYNVIAHLEGSRTQDTMAVLGAHYDCLTLGPDQDPYTYSPGANNNASGVAACLEVARLIIQQESQPIHPIDFVAFGSEEFMTMFAEGGSGAENYVGQLKDSGRYVFMMIDNNQISYRPSADDWRLDFQNCPRSSWITDAARYYAGRYTRIVPVDTSDHINYTDAFYFWSAGYPAIFFEEYHFCPHTFTDKDIPENCDMTYCAEVAKISMALLLGFSYWTPD